MNRAAAAAHAASAAILLALVACASSTTGSLGSGPATSGGAGATAPSGSGDTAGPAVAARTDAIQAAVAAWAEAATLPDARAAAEGARNLVTGADVSGYGDLDGDGEAMGASRRGLLPGESGEPGLVTSPAPSCVERDVLGGSRTDPAGRWAELDRAIADWAPTDNTFPSLASHPQRVVGWATLTLNTSSLDSAHEYAGHAQIHVDVTTGALAGC